MQRKQRRWWPWTEEQEMAPLPETGAERRTQGRGVREVKRGRFHGNGRKRLREEQMISHQHRL